eukprot:2859241-Pleurochrysis_carterae.AAC.2
MTPSSATFLAVSSLMGCCCPASAAMACCPSKSITSVATSTSSSTRPVSGIRLTAVHTAVAKSTMSTASPFSHGGTSRIHPNGVITGTKLSESCAHLSCSSCHRRRTRV